MYIYVYIDVYIGIYRFIGSFNCRQGHVFMVQTKPLKAPLGLVACGVPIEKVRAKRAMRSDWGGPTLDKAVYLGFEVSPRNNPSDWSRMVFQ